MGLGISLSLFLASDRPDHLFADPAFRVGVIALCLVTAMTFLPAFKRFEPWLMTAIPLLDFAVIGLFGLIPGVIMGSAIIAVMPAMWLGGTLGRRGILYAAAASAFLVVVPDFYLHGVSAHAWSNAISVILFSTLGAAGVSLSTQIWGGQVLRLEHQQESLRHAIDVKDDFIALVSHELRTPLTSIIGYLDLVSEGDDQLSPETVSHLAAVSRNADRLLLLVTDLLTAHESVVKPMRLTIETFDVGALVQLSVDDIRVRMREGGLTLDEHLPPGIFLQADPDRFLQITDSLLSNALKFTPPGGRVSVTVCRRALGIDLIVTDTGVGMDELTLQGIGTKFFRSPKTTAAAIPGIGLGLMITKSIVEAHEGTISFTSTEGVGTSATVHMPALVATKPTDQSPWLEASTAGSSD